MWRILKSFLHNLIVKVYLIVLALGAFFAFLATGKILVMIIVFVAGTVLWFSILRIIDTIKIRINTRRAIESGADIIDSMDGYMFEEFLLELLKYQGYRGHLTPKTDDYGADLVLKKDGRKIVVQAKRWKRAVGLEAVQQIIGAIKFYGANKGIVITNSSFTENAYKLANMNGIELWDRKELFNLCHRRGIIDP
jgi:HJR/Mrr/RecB family endonuclease